MIKVFVDSGSSIKQNEKDKYGVEILPLKILMKDKEYLDGIDLEVKDFYDMLINEKLFPKTSLPSMLETEEKVNEYVNKGYDVIIVTISSGISGTYNMLRTLFENESKVHVVDSKSAVGGIRLIVDEINRNKDLPVEEILAKVENLIPRIRILAVPETLEYLHRGGRLSKLSFVVGSLQKIKPLITFKEGLVKVHQKAIGLANAMKMIIAALNKCDENHKIVPSYTYDDKNLDVLISNTDEKYKKLLDSKDNLDLAIASHWGPNAFGFIFVEKENV